WMHNNMITINGQKMGKSLGNSILLEEFFTGKHRLLTQAYTPMTVRFFILQAHYRSTLDFSNEALQAAEKGLKRLLEAAKTLEKLPLADTNTHTAEVDELAKKIIAALDDDLNTPVAIAHLFDAVRLINAAHDKKEPVGKEAVEQLQRLFNDIVSGVLGLRNDQQAAGNNALLDGVINMILDVRATAKANKDFATSDKIRDELAKLGIVVKDTKESSNYSLQ
ncbi:MAG: cysteine--tRNA ligase, partial [Prevotellaceae bacterium]|nr:cysteine--tRNA ligase [Prevotellaceae bacterium]